jgi:DNA topoisomerase IB
VGTSTALEEISKLPIPETKLQFKQQVTKVCGAVAEKLGNTPAVAKGSYISPEVWSVWESALQ